MLSQSRELRPGCHSKPDVWAGVVPQRPIPAIAFGFPLVDTASLLSTVFVGVTVNSLIGAFVGSSVNDVHSRRLIHRIPKMIPVMALTVVWNVEYGRR